MSRYLIIGCSGSGKSTLARQISAHLSIPYIDVDSLYWGSAWQVASDEEVLQALPLTEDSWVLDGNFIGHRDIIWEKATAIIWVKPSLGKIMSRLIRRNLSWWLCRKQTWSDTPMPLSVALSGIRHAWKRHPQILSDYPTFLAEYSHKKTYCLSTEQELEDFLTSHRSS